MSFTTPLTLRGPLREPRQMLADQEYGGHSSIHDDAMAEKLGFRAGPIEGPTHFSLFPPLLDHIWGYTWFERGCLSAHYLNMVVEGEATRAFVDIPPGGGGTATKVWAEKADGTPVLEASATLGPDHGQTLLETRLAALRPPERLVILADLRVGMTGAEDEMVRMDADQHMGALYPFSLNQKLAVITETTPWYSDPAASPWGRPIIPLEMVSVLAEYSSSLARFPVGIFPASAASPWGRPIIPLEMVSVLAEYSSSLARFPVKGPAVGLFADQEIRMVDGPLFVGEDYLIRREIAALSESRRTESYWVRTRIYDASGTTLKAEMLLNHATLKDSYAGYADALAVASA